MARLSWETPLDRRRAEERERERGEAIRGLREVEEPISPGGPQPPQPPLPPTPPGVEPGPSPLPSVPTSYTPREVSARAQSFGVSIPQFLGAPQAARGEAATVIGEGYGGPPALPPDFQEELERRYQENLDIRLETLERRNRQRAVDDLPPLTVEGEKEAAWQHAVSVMRSKEVTTPLSLAAGAVEVADVGRQWVKEKVIDPVVPEFKLPVEVPVSPDPILGQLVAPWLREQLTTGVRGVEAITGISEPALIESKIPGAKVKVTITSAMVEEAASWVLDPINLVFFIGPELKALKAAGGVIRLANQIRKTKNVPAFVKAAMRVAQSEVGGRAAGRGLERTVIEKFGTTPKLEEAGLILRDGRLVPVGGAESRFAHKDLVSELGPQVGMDVDPLAEFLKESGAVRMGTSTVQLGAFAEISGPVTAEQRQVLARLLRRSAALDIDVGYLAPEAMEATSLRSTAVTKPRELGNFLDDLVRNPPAEWGAPGVEAARGGARRFTAEEVEKAAISAYGTTKDLDRVGYILQDGRMANLAQPRRGRGIAAYDEHGDLLEKLGVDWSAITGEEINRIMGQGGVIRVVHGGTMHGGVVAYVELATMPTQAQRKVLLDLLKAKSGGLVIEARSPLEAGQAARGRSADVVTVPELRRFLDDLTRNPPEGFGVAGRGVEVRPDFPPYDTLPPESSGYVYHTTGGFGETGEKVLGDIRRSGELTAGIGQDEVLMREAIEAGEKVPKEFGIPKVYFDVQPAWEYGGDTPLVLRMKRSKKFSLTEGFDAWYTKKSVPAERLEWYGADGTWRPVVEPVGRGVGVRPAELTAISGEVLPGPEIERAILSSGRVDDVTEAGWILSDGRMVRVEGTHTDIVNRLPSTVQTGLRERVLSAGANKDDPLHLITAVSEETGAIRVSKYKTRGGKVGREVVINVEPTDAQLQQIMKLQEDIPVLLLEVRAVGHTARFETVTTINQLRAFFNDIPVYFGFARADLRGPPGRAKLGPGTFAPVGPEEWTTKVPVEIGEIEEVGGFPARFPIKIRGGPAEGLAPGEWLARTEAAGAARPPMGPEMPPPVKPPVPGGLPPPGMEPPIEGAIAKLSTLIKQAKKPLRGQTLLRHEEMQRRFGQVAERLRTAEGTPIEVAARARAALGGERAKIAYEPVLPLMTGEDVQALFLRANTFDFGLGRTAENVRAADALTKALLGELPQQAEQVLLEQVFGKELLLALRGKGPMSHQVYRNLIDLMALPKTALTFLDHSFPGRQGIKLAPSHPAAWTKSAWYGIRAGARERVAQDMVRARALDSTPILVREGETVRTIPYGKLKEMAGVYEASFAEAVPLAAREEAFVSHWARAIPLWGKAVKISERMYITSGNEIRHDVTRGLLQAANRGGEPIELETAKALAALNNRASGRGTIGIDEFAPVLNSLFFAPRYRISPVQWTAHLLHRDPVVRKEAARQVVSFVTAGATLMALLKYSGLADVNIDPNSADFGKARVGKTRIDIWAHLQQIARSVSMLITGERLTSTGEKVDVDREEIAWRYFRTGLAPIPGLLEDIRAGETIIGEEMEPTAAGVRTQLFNRLTPLAWQDIIDGVREEGARGGMISALALAGIGIMTYETYAQERARDFQKETGMEFDYANSGHWAILRTNPALKEKYGELGDVAQETQDFLTEQMTELGLPDMARQLSSGTADPQVFTSFREAWEDFEGIRAKSAARMAYGRDRDPADDPVFQRYMEIDRDDPKYKDPVTFEIDYGAYRRDKDAAFEQLDPTIQMAFQAVGAPDPEVAEWATLYVMSRNLRRQLYGMSKWEGLTPEQSRRLDQFTREVSRRAPQIAEQMGQRVSEASVAQALAEERGAPGLAEWFIALQSPRTRDRMRNPDYEGFIAENKVGLQLFYPELYSQALLERIGAIEGAPPGPQPPRPPQPPQPPRPPVGVR